MRFRASEAATATDGRLIGPDAVFDGATFDSRELAAGQLFVALVADRDGHEYLPAAFDAGAAVALVQSGRPRPGVIPEGVSLIEVDDTAVSLRRLAAWARRHLLADTTVVGITGSVGKTTTKDLLGVALTPSRRVVVNPRSFNNDQGLPVTVLGAPDGTEVLVLEMGMRGFGEITRLCEVAAPHIGLVTAVGHSHTARVGGIEGVQRAKSELVRALATDGTAVLNADDPRVAAMRALAAGPVITYGRAESADVRIAGLELDELARPRFTVLTPWGRHEVVLGVSGGHMASNAAAALAVTGVVGGDLGAAVEALAGATASSMRMAIERTPTGALVVNDAYNANPTSTSAALESLARMRARRRVAVLGTMAELDDPAGGHLLVAELAARLGIEVIAVGTELYGVPAVDDPVEAVEAVGPLGEGDVVLVKASRMAGLERVAAALLGR